MPLFMDLHKASDYSVKPTMEEIKRNHIADLATQHKYNVKFLQYWINEEAGLVFCLMEAPDKESCAAVHREAHGDMPCNVIELQGGDYQAFMGGDMSVNTFDIVERGDGTLDTGYRVIMAAAILYPSAGATIYHQLEQVADQAGGRLVPRPGNRLLIAFTEGHAAIECALHLIKQVREEKGTGIEIRIGIGAGEPVTDSRDLFGDSVQLANRLCDIAQHGQVVIAPLVKQLTKVTVWQSYAGNGSLKLLNQEEERFLGLLMNSTSAKLSQPDFTIQVLEKQLGMSKSQLYRKITELTGYSANAFIRELRLQKAFQLLRDKYGNVTQVAMEAGFTNPSYFAKNFRDRFGISPLEGLKSQS